MYLSEYIYGLPTQKETPLSTTTGSATRQLSLLYKPSSPRIQNMCNLTCDKRLAGSKHSSTPVWDERNVPVQKKCFDEFQDKAFGDFPFRCERPLGRT